MISVCRRDRGMSPTLGVILLLVVMVLTTSMAATFVFSFAPDKAQEEVTGVEVTFTEDEYGSVVVRLVEQGTADNVYVNTSEGGYKFTETGDTHQVAPGEGDITIIAESDGHKVVAQTFTPEHSPDERLVADPGPTQQQPPGSSYTFNASDSVGDITEYRWDFNGDGQTDATGKLASHTWSEPGVYEVALTVESSSGATHTNTTTVRNAHLVVAKDGSGHHTTIQGAVDNSTDGDTILVTNAKYEESVWVHVSNITLFSESAPVIDGTNVSANPALDITAAEVTVRGLRVTDFDESAGIRADASGIVLDEVSVARSGVDELTGAVTATMLADELQIHNSRVAASTGCGVVLGDNSDIEGGPFNAKLTDSLVHSSENFGVCSMGTSQNTTIMDARIKNNDAGGVLLWGTENTTLLRTEVRKNGYTQDSGIGALYAYETAGITIRESNLSENFNGGLTFNDVENVTIRKTGFIKNKQTGIRSRGHEENTELSNTFSDLGISIQGVSNVRIHDSNIDRNQHYGAFLNSTEDFLLQNSTFRYNGNTSDVSLEGIYMRSKGPNEVRNTTIRYSKLYGSGEEDVFVESKNQNASATENWWGQDTGPNDSQYGGAVDVDPYCTVEDCSDQK